MTQDAPGDAAPDYAQSPRCSARGCREDACVELRWRNPKLHAGGRTKIWLACAVHADSLADFLGRRGFLLGRDQLPPAPPIGPVA
jgi:hypothetical protein